MIKSVTFKESMGNKYTVKMFNGENYKLDLPFKESFLSTSIEEILTWEVGKQIKGVTLNVFEKSKITRHENIIATLIHKSSEYVVIHVIKPYYSYVDDGKKTYKEFMETMKDCGGVFCINTIDSNEIENIFIVDLKNKNIEIGKVNDFFIQKIREEISNGIRKGQCFDYIYSVFEDWKDATISNFCDMYPEDMDSYIKIYKGKEYDIKSKYTNTIIKDIINFNDETYVLAECTGIFVEHNKGDVGKINSWNIKEQTITVFTKATPYRKCIYCNNCNEVSDYKEYNLGKFEFDIKSGYICLPKNEFMRIISWNGCDDYFKGKVKYGTIIKN